MASQITSKTLVIFAFSLAFLLQGSLGSIECENLNKESCAFAVSASGKRCVLEKHVRRSGEEAYACTASEILADKMTDYTETEECVSACGLDRSALGISSDLLLDSRFTQKLCSSDCYQSCPNVVDLYFNLAAGEGVYLPRLCDAKLSKARREMAEIKSSGAVIGAPAPELPGIPLDGAILLSVPAPAPF